MAMATSKTNNPLHIYKLSFNYADNCDNLKERNDFPIVAHNEQEARQMIHEFCQAKHWTEFSIRCHMEKATPKNAHIRTEEYFQREQEALRKEIEKNERSLK